MAVEKPRDREDEYVVKMNLEKVNKIRGELDQTRAQEEQQKQKGFLPIKLLKLMR